MEKVEKMRDKKMGQCGKLRHNKATFLSIMLAGFIAADRSECLKKEKSIIIIISIALCNECTCVQEESVRRSRTSQVLQ